MFSLTPSVSVIEEGRQYQAMLDEGLSVEEIAERMFQATVDHVRYHVLLAQRFDEDVAGAHVKA